MKDNQKTTESKSSHLRNEGVDYKWRDDLNENNQLGTAPIELIPSGLVVRFGNVVFDKDSENNISFEYAVIENSNGVEIDDTITTQMGDIIVSWMLEMYTGTAETDNADRNNNLEESFKE